ncbi:MAG: ribonuclease HII [Brevefilum sp.]
MMPRVKFDLSLLPKSPNLEFEQELWSQGFRRIAGIDEAGRGALAGPVAAAAAILPSDRSDLLDCLHGVRDSKEMTPGDREIWANAIKDIAIAWEVGFASAAEIDRLGIVPATCLAASRALAGLNYRAEHLLVDFLTLPDAEVAQTPLVKGDARSLSIACASILAKTARDALLIEMNDDYPGYGFCTNKGYATKAHRMAIRQSGPCKQHRRTFAPVADYFTLFPPEVSEENDNYTSEDGL